MKVRLTPEQKRVMYLSEREQRQRELACYFRGHLRDLFRPITLPDGTYWRHGRWNRPTTENI